MRVFAFLKNYPSTRQLFETSMIPVDFEAIFKAINGDVSFAITDLEQVKFAMYANVSNNSFLQTIENLKPILALTGGQVTLVNKGPHAYEISMQNADWTGLPPTMKHLWIGVEEDRFYLTNDEPLIKAQVSGKTLKDMEWSKSVDGKYGFISQNGEVILPLEYTKIGDCFFNYYPIKKDNKWGLADLLGKVVVQCEYDNIEYNIEKNQMRLKKDDKHTYITELIGEYYDRTNY